MYRDIAIHLLLLLGFNTYIDEGPYLADNAPVDCAFETTAADLFELINSKSPEAMQRWPKAKALFLSGLPKRHSLFVTFILVDAEGRAEYVFLAVDSIDGKEISGRLWTNVVVVEGFDHGDRFLLPEDAIRDWVISRPDGSEDGNLIGKYIDTLQRCTHLNNQSEVSKEDGS